MPTYPIGITKIIVNQINTFTEQFIMSMLVRCLFKWYNGKEVNTLSTFFKLIEEQEGVGK